MEGTVAKHLEVSGNSRRSPRCYRHQTRQNYKSLWSRIYIFAGVEVLACGSELVGEVTCNGDSIDLRIDNSWCRMICAFCNISGTL